MRVLLLARAKGMMVSHSMAWAASSNSICVNNPIKTNINAHINETRRQWTELQLLLQTQSLTPNHCNIRLIFALARDYICCILHIYDNIFIYKPRLVTILLFGKK